MREQGGVHDGNERWLRRAQVTPAESLVDRQLRSGGNDAADRRGEPLRGRRSPLRGARARRRRGQRQRDARRRAALRRYLDGLCPGAARVRCVCKPAGKIGLANWTPEGFIGQMFKIIGKYVPPAAGLKPPSLWGTRARLEELFGSKGKVQATSRHFSFRYRSPQHFIEVFSTWYGPMNKTFAALDGDRERQAAFGRDLLELIERGNRSGDGTMVVPSEYLEVVIERNR